MKLMIASLTVLAVTLLAQGPGPRTMRGMGSMRGAGNPAALTQYLGLTDAQAAQMKQVNQTFFEAVKPIREQARSTAQQLRQLTQNNGDATAIGKLVQAQKDLRDQVKSLADKRNADTQAILTADQKDKLTALQQALTLAPAARQALRMGLIQPPAGAGAGQMGAGAFGFGRGMAARRAGMGARGNPAGPPQ